MVYNYVQALDNKFSRYLNGYTVTYFNENTNCRPKDLTPEQAQTLGVFPVKIVTPPAHDPLTQALELADAVMVEDAWTQVWAVTELDPEQQAQKEAEARRANKQQAGALLTATDWVELGDVSDPNRNPHLTNKEAFSTYREQLRAIAVNPPVTPAEFPVAPEEIWSE
jgi:hypothetical protein